MRLSDRWFSVLTLLGAAWAAVVKLLDWGGRADFIYGHSGDAAGAMILVRSIFDPPTWVAGPVFLACVGLFLWDMRRAHVLPHQLGRRRTTVDPYLATAAVAAVVMVGALAAYLLRKQAGPVEWNFNLVGSPIGVAYSEGEPLRILSFQISGKNISRQSIEPMEAYIRSDVDYTKINLGVVKGGKIISLTKAVIGSDVNFYLAYSFPTSDPMRAAGLSPEQFRSQYGSFTFCFKSDGYDYKKSFNRREVDDIVDRIARQMRESAESAKQTMQGGVIEKP